MEKDKYLACAWPPAAEVRLPNGKPVIGRRLGRILDALFKKLIPDGGSLPVNPDNTGAGRFLAQYLSQMSAGARAGLKALLFAFDLAPIIFIGRFARFVNLTPQEQDLYLHDWYASRIYYRRMVLVLLKTITGMGFYNDPKVLDFLRYKLPCGDRNLP